MSIKNVDVPFRCHVHHGAAQEFVGISELGFNARGTFVVDAHTTARDPEDGRRGGYLTSVPISPLDYRRENPTRAAFTRETKTRLVVYDDYGHPHRFEAPHEIIHALAVECAANELPEK